MDYNEQKECPGCGTIIEEGEVECPSCGESFVDNDDEVHWIFIGVSIMRNFFDEDEDDDDSGGEEDW